MTQNTATTTQLTWSEDIDNSRGGMCRTMKARPTSRYFLPDNLRAVEVENMEYDEDFNQLTITAKPGELAVAYCELYGKSELLHFQDGPNYDVIYIFEVQEGELYPELPVQPGKVVNMNVYTGQRLFLPANNQIEVLAGNNIAPKVNEGRGGFGASRDFFLEQIDGRMALAVGVYADGRTSEYREAEKTLCSVTIDDQDPCVFVFTVSSPTVTTANNAAQPKIAARNDLIRTGPNTFLTVVADEEEVFLVPDHLEVRHCLNATYNKSQRTITAHRKEGQKTQVFFTRAVANPSRADISVGIAEFALVKKPEHPYLPDMNAELKIVTKTKRGSKFTLPGDSTKRAFQISSIVNARIQYEDSRKILEVGVDEQGNPVKAKRGQGKAVLVVDIGDYDPLLDCEQPPVLATYIFEY